MNDTHHLKLLTLRTWQVDIKPPHLFYKSDLFGLSSDGQIGLTLLLYVWDDDPLRQQQLGAQDYCLLLTANFSFIS